MAHFCPGDRGPDQRSSSSSGPHAEPQETREVWCPSVQSKEHGTALHGLQEWLGGFPRKEMPSAHFLWELELYASDSSVGLLPCVL